MIAHMQRLATLLLFGVLALLSSSGGNYDWHSAQAIEVLSTLAQIEQVEASPRLYALLVVSSAEAKEHSGMDAVLDLAHKAFPPLGKLERDLEGVATFAVVDTAQHKKALAGKWNLHNLPALLVFKDEPKVNPYTHKVYRSPMVASVDLLNQPAKLRKILRDSVPSTFVTELQASALETPVAVEALVQTHTQSGATLVLLVSKQKKPSPLYRALATEFHDQGLRFAFVTHAAPLRRAAAVDSSSSSSSDGANGDEKDAESALLTSFQLDRVPALLAIQSPSQFTALADDKMTSYAALKAFAEQFVDKDAAAAAADAPRSPSSPSSQRSTFTFLTERSFEQNVLASKLVWIIAFTDADDVAAAVEAAWQKAFGELQKKAGMVALAAVQCGKEPALCERYGGAGIRVFPVKVAQHGGSGRAAVVERGDVLPETFTDVEAAKDAALASLPSDLVHVIQSSLDLSGFVSRAAVAKALPVLLFTAKTDVPSVLRAISLSLPTYNVAFGVVPDADADVKAQFTIPATATTAFVSLVMTDKDAAQTPQGASPFGVILYNKKTMGAYTYENMMHYLLSVLAQYPHPLERVPDDELAHEELGGAASDLDGASATASTLVPYLQRSNVAQLCAGNAICAIGFFSEHVDRLADADSALSKSVSVLGAVAARSQRSKEPFRFMWTSGACQRAFAEAFGVGEFQMPTVVVYSPSKRRYATNVGTFTVENTHAFLASVLSGKIGTAPVGDVPPLRDECSYAEVHGESARGVGGDGDSSAATSPDGHGSDDDDDADLLSEILEEEQQQRALLEEQLRQDAKDADASHAKKGKRGKKPKSKGKKQKSKKSKKSKSSSTRDEL